MKHPAAAAGVLALHLLGLLALSALPLAQQRAAATEPAAAQRALAPGVLLVALRSPAAPALPPAVVPNGKAPKSTAPKPATDAVAVPTTWPVQAARPTSVAIATPAPEAVAEAASAAAPVPTPTASAAPTPPPPLVATAAPAPALTLAQADRRDCPAAPHPAALRERGIEGEVLLLVRVGTDGRAAEVRLQQTSGWRLFDHAALAQAQACRFVPARRGVQAVESWVDFPVRFSLRG